MSLFKFSLGARGYLPPGGSLVDSSIHHQPSMKHLRLDNISRTCAPKIAPPPARPLVESNDHDTRTRNRHRFLVHLTCSLVPSVSGSE